MKERYETPEMEIVEFETEDIITTSGNADDNSLPGMLISQFIVVYSVRYKSIQSDKLNPEAFKSK